MEKEKIRRGRKRQGLKSTKHLSARVITRRRGRGGRKKRSKGALITGPPVKVIIQSIRPVIIDIALVTIKNRRAVVIRL